MLFMGSWQEDNTALRVLLYQSFEVIVEFVPVAVTHLLAHLDVRHMDEISMSQLDLTEPTISRGTGRHGKKAKDKAPKQGGRLPPAAPWLPAEQVLIADEIYKVAIEEGKGRPLAEHFEWITALLCSHQDFGEWCKNCTGDQVASHWNTTVSYHCYYLTIIY
jgi:hypothetical protein